LHGWKIFIFLEQICIYTPKQGIIEDVDDQAETIIRLSSWDQQIKIHKMLRLVSFFTIIIGFLFFSLWQPFLAAGRPIPPPSKFKNHTLLTISLSRTFSVQAGQPITNSDYGVSANGNISAAGETLVVTFIEAETNPPVPIYLPVLLKASPLSLK
jgi:hypothetical protein